jgi:hypothetical protein
MYVNVGNQLVTLGRFGAKTNEGVTQGFANGIEWERRSTTGVQNLCFGTAQDQKHRVSMTIPSTYFDNGSLDIDFLAGTTGNLDSESFGIDNILMTALGDCDPDSICVDEKVVIERQF